MKFNNKIKISLVIMLLFISFSVYQSWSRSGKVDSIHNQCNEMVSVKIKGKATPVLKCYVHSFWGLTPNFVYLRFTKEHEEELLKRHKMFLEEKDAG